MDKNVLDVIDSLLPTLDDAWMALPDIGAEDLKDILDKAYDKWKVSRMLELYKRREINRIQEEVVKAVESVFMEYVKLFYNKTNRADINNTVHNEVAHAVQRAFDEVDKVADQYLGKKQDLKMPENTADKMKSFSGDINLDVKLDTPTVEKYCGTLFKADLKTPICKVTSVETKDSLMGKSDGGGPDKKTKDADKDMSNEPIWIQAFIEALDELMAEETARKAPDTEHKHQ